MIDGPNYPIKKLELLAYFIVWIVHCVSSFRIGIRVSQDLTSWINHSLDPSPYVENLQYDKSDLEWFLHKKALCRLFVYFGLHSIVFRIAHRFYHRSPHLTQIFLIIFWTFLTTWITSLQSFVLITIFAICLVTSCAYLRRESFAWITCVFLVLFANKYGFFSPEPDVFYLEYTIYLYKAVQILNVCISLCRHPERPLSLNFLLNICEYLLYPMYSLTLIVLYEDFEIQINALRRRVILNSWWPSNINGRKLFFQALRLLFWFFIIEIFLHFIYANAILHSAFTLITGLNNYEVACISYMAGIFFHLKYVFIFGLPSLFALIDGMTPPGPPVCISRISKYSQMWRYFDRGLYEFLKHQVYIPFMGNATGINLIIRRLIAMISVFSFVIAWHGTKSNYLTWVALSATEIILERIGMWIVSTKQWRKFSKNIGPANVIRITAVSMIFTIIPGLLGVFYFLSQVGTGDEILRKLLIEGIQGILNKDISYGFPGGVLAHMISLGYFYNHCCLYLEYKYHPRLVKSKVE